MKSWQRGKYAGTPRVKPEKALYWYEKNQKKKLTDEKKKSRPMAMSNEDRKPISVHMSLDAKTWDLFKKICNVEMGLPANRVVESLLEVILDQSKARPMMEKMIADAAKAQKMELSEDQLQTVVATAIKDGQKKLEEM